MDGKDENPMMKMTVDLIKESAPAICKKCPYSVSHLFTEVKKIRFILIHILQGDYRIANLTFKTDKFMSVFPSGIYKNVVWMYDDIDDNISKLIFYTSVKSEIIESF